jgi:RNA polymerase sigma factor (sigma-70 family)
MRALPSTPGSTRGSLATRASLLHRLKDWNDQASWQEFFDTYWKLIYGVARKAGLGDPEARDVVQDTVLTVAKQMPDFRYDPQAGSFKAWLLTVTRSRITDHLRKNARHPRPPQAPAGDSSTRTSTLDRIPDPADPPLDAVWEEEWQKNLREAALERVKQRVKPKTYQLFDCFVLRGWPMAEVTRTLRVSMGQVYFARIKVGALLKKELNRLEKQWG